MFALEYGGEHARLWLDLDSSPTFWYLIGFDVGGLHLTALSLGPMLGSSTFRAGPFAGIGPFLVELGVHAVWSPWEGPSARRGFEVRAAYLPFHAFEGTVVFRWGWEIARRDAAGG